MSPHHPAGLAEASSKSWTAAFDGKLSWRLPRHPCRIPSLNPSGGRLRRHHATHRDRKASLAVQGPPLTYSPQSLREQTSVSWNLRFPKRDRDSLAAELRFLCMQSITVRILSQKEQHHETILSGFGCSGDICYNGDIAESG